MSLKDLNLERGYRSNKNNMVKDFYNPVLSNAVLYKRAVGYFTISSLISASQGLYQLIKNGGKVQIVASPSLTEEDIRTIEMGYKMKEDVVLNAMIREFNDITSEYIIEKLNYIATLIADDRLEIKIALMDDYGAYHEKFGLVEDEDHNKILFTGSMNETYRGQYKNFESFVVFESWNEEQVSYIEDFEKDFIDLWDDSTYRLEVVDFPEALKKKILEFKRDNLVKEIQEDYYKDNNQVDKIDITEDIADIKMYPKIPDWFEARPYQKDAISSWKNNDYKGLLSMATGTGKTLTALYGLTELWNNVKRLVTIIVCPYQHLVEQWAEDVKKFNIFPVLCYSSYGTWRRKIYNRINLINSNTIDNFTIITTNATFVTSDMQNFIRQINADILLIVDEAHNAGTNSMKKALHYNYKYNLGLSATPKRFRDEENTEFIYSFFGGEVFNFDLERAIYGSKDEQCLTEYYYYPKIIELTDEEQEEYDDLSLKIAHNIKEENGKIILNEVAKMLLIKRSKIVAGAKNKLVLLNNIMKDFKEKYNILVYCGATSYKNDEVVERQIDKVCKILGRDLRMKIRKFTAEESPDERQEIIDMFSNDKSLQAIVAIKCLDEGVNIPAIQHAFIMASTTDPKEFIQRRGRVLRKFPGKSYAYIYDFVTIPNGGSNKGKNLVETELKRVYEFTALSKNKEENNSLIKELTKEYDIDIEKIKDVRDKYNIRSEEYE